LNHRGLLTPTILWVRSLGLTVLLISSGVSYVRWLAEIDAEMMSKRAYTSGQPE